ncbi:MAG: OmpA family protein [Acidobacteria bacterium]|nr:OmpA family protein [Acidobacteriota bacterium]
MERVSTVQPIWTVLLGLAALGGLCGLCLRWEGPAIEADLTSRVAAALASSEVLARGVEVEADGQSVVLAGVAPDAAARAEAVQLAARVWGVDRVVDRIDVRGALGGEPLGNTDAEAARACQVELNQTLMQGRIEFAPGTAVLEEWSYPALDRLAEVTGVCPAPNVQVSVYTDAGGGAESSRELSQQRAEALVYHLLRKGVHPSRLTARGYGDEGLDPAAGRRERIELSVAGL